MNNQEYWAARAQARQAVYSRSAAQAVQATNQAIRRSMGTLKKEMDDILRVFGKRHGLTREEALALLQSPVDMDTQMALQAQLASITDPMARRVFQAAVEAPSYAARLSRAQALQDSIVLESVKVAQVEQEALKQHLTFTYMEGVDRFAYDLSRRVGRMFEYARPSIAQAQEVLRHRWAGGNYSARVWGNAKQMANSLQSALMENVLAGKTSEETWQELVTAAQGSAKSAQRLIRTETAYVAGQAEKHGYMEAGLDSYKYVAQLEARTCQVCGKLDGQIFAVRDGIPGKNMEPMHPWCMCTTMPWDEEIAALEADETRWAKDPETGKTVEVPANMTYAQWQEQYDKLHPDMPMARQRGKI